MHLTQRELEVIALLRRVPTMKPAVIAAQLGSTPSAINVHLSNLTRKGVILGRGYLLNEEPGAVVVGGANIDIKARSNAGVVAGTSNPGMVSIRPGGVGRNVAENLARLGTRTHLVSIVGRDPYGDSLISQTAAAGVNVDHVVRVDAATGTYTAVLDASGDLVVAVASMQSTDGLRAEHIDRARSLVASAAMVIVDGNVRTETLDHVLVLASAAQARVIVEPVSVAKARAISPSLNATQPVFAITPNRDELSALTGLPTGTRRDVVRAAASLHDRGAEVVWVRLGKDGSLLSRRDVTPTVIKAVPTTVDDVTGAGDAALAAFCHALLAGDDMEAAARFGHAAASLTIASSHTVRPDLTEQLVRSTLQSLDKEPT